MSKERDVRMKNGLKTKEMSRQKVLKETIFNRKRQRMAEVSNKSAKWQENTGNKKNGAKRKPCQENAMWREENVKRRSQVSRKRDAQRQGCQEKETSTESGWNDIGFKRQRWHQQSLSGERGVSSLWPQRRPQEGPSRFRNVRSKPDQEKVAASNKDVESKKCQGQRLPSDHAVDGRASQGRYSYRLSLIGSSLSRNFRHLARPGSTFIFSILIERTSFQEFETRGDFEIKFLATC